MKKILSLLPVISMLFAFITTIPIMAIAETNSICGKMLPGYLMIMTQLP